MAQKKPDFEDVYSEEDVKNKIVVPYFKELGYKSSQFFYEVPIKAWLGRESKTVRADIVIKEDNNALIIVEVKKPGTILDEVSKEQAISYARQFDPRAVPIAVVTNGATFRIYDVRTKKSVPEIPTKKDWASILTDIHISEEEKREAGRFIVKGYENVQGIKEALNRCHDIIRSNDGLDPISSFDEINKLIYTRIQEEKWATENKAVNRFTSDHIKHHYDPVEEMNNMFRNAANMLGEHKIFPPEEKISLSKESIISIVEILEQRSIALTDHDIIGLAYESFLPSIFRGERLGQFFTPDRLKEFMVEFLQPRIGDKVIDPAFGSGGFLVLVFKKLLADIYNSNISEEEKEQKKNALSSEDLYGTEINPRLAIACKTNMYLRGDGRTNIYRHTGLLNCGNIKEGMFDIVITNPPFGSFEEKREVLEHYELGVGKRRQATEVLFLERCVRLLKEGGKLGIVLPESISINSNYKNVRKWMDDNVTINAIFKMPSFAFTPSGTSGISTNLIFMTKKRPAETDYPIFMSRVEKIGYDQANKPDIDVLSNALEDYKRYSLKNEERFDNKNPHLFSFVVRREKGENIISVNFYKPEYLRLLKRLKSKKHLHLKDIATREKNSITDGPFGTQLHTSDYQKEGIPLIRVKNIGKGEFKEEDLVFIAEDKHSELLRSKIVRNDVLIAKTGATFGKACLYPGNKFKEANITASCCKISPDISKVDPYYLVELINSEVVYLQLKRYSEKSAQPGFNLIELKKVIIPEVSLSRQKEIVKEIKSKKKDILNVQESIKERERDIEKVSNDIQELLIR